MVNNIPMGTPMPHDTNAEQAVLGSIFLDNTCLAEALDYVTAKSFYHVQNRNIFTAMVELNAKDKPMNSVTVSSLLKSKHEMTAEGYKYMASVVTSMPTATDVKYYAEIVRDKAIARRMVRAGQQISQDGMDKNEDVDGMIDSAQQTLLGIEKKRHNHGFSPLDGILSGTDKDIKTLSRTKGDVTGIPTGFPAIDKITTGLHDGEFVIVAARPAMGKTTFALNVAQNVARRTKGTVALFSLEMGAQSLATRMLCARGNISANHLRTGNLNKDEWQNVVTNSIDMADDTHVNIDDTPGINIATIMARARRLKKKKGDLQLIVVDYLQLVEGDQSENRQQEVSGISRQLKKLAKELDTPVIALSQLSRKVEQREDKRPILSDIRESGSIEQDADIVSFLYRKDYYERGKDGDKQKVQQDNSASDTEYIIEKNRSGPRGTIHLMFIKDYNKFAPIISTPKGMHP